VASIDSDRWTQLYKRLGIVAAALARSAPSVFDGISVVDLPAETLLAFFESPDGLGWDPTRGDLESFLGGVLKNKLLTRLRRHMRVAGSLDDDAFGYKCEPQVNGDGPPQAAFNSLVKTLKRGAGRNRAFRAFIRAALHYDGGNNVNEQMAAALGIKPRQVVALRRKFTRRFGRTRI
jgi:hypothetical protein